MIIYHPSKELVLLTIILSLGGKKDLRMLHLTFKFMQISILKNKALHLILFISMIICCAVFIQFNVSYINDKRRYFAEDIKMHSVAVDLKEQTTYVDALKVSSQLSNNRHVEYYILHTTLEENKYNIKDAYTFYIVNRNPFEKVVVTDGSLSANSTNEPQVGHAYLGFQFSLFEASHDLTIGKPFRLSEAGPQYINQCAVAFSEYEMIISNEDFKEYNSVDRIIYSYDSTVNLKHITKLNQNIKRIVPKAEFNISYGLEGDEKTKYQQSMIFISILLAACVINYNFVFLFLVNRRMDQLIIVRLLGSKKMNIFFMIFMEMLSYAMTTFILVITGFMLYWLWLYGWKETRVNLNNSIQIFFYMFGMNLLIGMVSAVRLTHKLPISYKER
jgi:hypothetical protein